MVWYTYNMPSEKLKQNQENTRKRLEKAADLQRHDELVSKFEEIRKTQLETTKILIKFLNGKTSKVQITNQLKEIGTPDVNKVVKAVELLDKNMQKKDLDWSPVTDVLDKVVQELEKKPNDLPEAPETVSIDFTSTNAILDKVVEAVTGLKGQLVVKAPDVNVKAPKVDVVVEKIDITELVQPLLDAVQAIRSYETPVFEATDLSQVEEYLKKANELLEKIEKKKMGGGGGGGGMVPFKSPTTGLSVQVATETDGSIPVTLVNPGDIASGGNYTTRIFEDSGDPDIVYVGKAQIGSDEGDSVWQIKALDTNNQFSKFWAESAGTPTDDFIFAWDDRESLVYS